MSTNNMTESDRVLPEGIGEALANVLRHLPELQTLVRMLDDPHLINLIKHTVAQDQNDGNAETVVSTIATAYNQLDMRYPKFFFCQLTPDMPVRPDELFVVAHIHSILALTIYLDDILPPSVWPPKSSDEEADREEVLEDCVRLWHYVLTQRQLDRHTGPFSIATYRTASQDACNQVLNEIRRRTTS